MNQAWTPKPGDCLLINSGPVGKHLFVIVIEASDGKQPKFISVPICTVREHARIDDACILQPGEHPFVKSESFIQYRYARDDSSEHLSKCVHEGTFIPQDSASPALINKIKAGLTNSRFVSRHIKDLLG